MGLPAPNPLPIRVTALLQTMDAPPRLIAHLQLVHHVAVQLTAGLESSYPTLNYDREQVLIGAATHDIGKIVFPAELIQSGNQHEDTGVDLLIQQGTHRSSSTIRQNSWQMAINEST